MRPDLVLVWICGTAISIPMLLWLSDKLATQRPKHVRATQATSRAAQLDPVPNMFSWVGQRFDWVVLDLETTGFSRRSEIIEIAIVGADGKTILNQQVMPKGRIPRDATKVHGITRKQLKGCPNWPEIFDQVAGILSGRPVITYNANFDLRLLKQTCEIWGLPTIHIDGHCAMLAYAAHRAEPHLHRKGEYRWHKLQNACADEGIEFDQQHRALSDAQFTRALLLRVARLRALANAA